MKTGWTKKYLRDVFDKASSNLSANKLAHNDGEYPVYGASGIVKYINFYNFDREYLAIIKDGAGVGRISKHKAYSSVLATLQYLLPKNNIDIRFGYYYLLSLDFSKYYQGSTIPHIYFKDYCAEKIELPPIPEQHRIVAILDDAFERIDKAIANTEKNIENAKELFDGYLNSIFTETVQNWNSSILSSIGIISTGSTPKTSQSENYGDGISFIKPSDFNTDGTLRYNNEMLSESGKSKSRIVPKHSILMVCIGATLGKVGFSDHDVTTNQQINSFIPNKNVTYKFIYYQMLSSFFRSQLFNRASQATLPIVNKSKWSSIKVHFPDDIEEQNIIAKQLASIEDSTILLERTYTQKIASLHALKQSLLAAAFSGELTAEFNPDALEL